MGEKEQEIHLVRVGREKLIGCRYDNFTLAAITVGLSERQQQKPKPR